MEKSEKSWYYDDPYIGEIRMWPCYFEPYMWAFCDGRLLSIAEYEALFSILGVTYGGDGITNFALPDLRGRFPIGMGSGPGLTAHTLGQQAGAESITVTQGPAGAKEWKTPATVFKPYGDTTRVDSMPPYLAINFIIALEGIYPSQS